MKIIFMGTPAFAVPILESLINSKHHVVAVYSSPLKPSGRGMNIIKSPAHVIADTYHIPVFTPSSLRNNAALEQFISFNADIVVVAAYGLILPNNILNAPKYGCINVHPSDLPRWRGAAPIQRSIMEGDKETALCIIRMDEGLDTGDVLLRHNVIIPEDMTAHDLSSHMATLGSAMVLQAINLIAANKATHYKQATKGIIYANKISKDEEKINWNREARLVHCQIRALSPKPCAYFVYNNEAIKIITATYTTIESGLPPGTIVDDKLNISCKSGIITPTLLQRPGRKMLYLDAFVRGYKIPQGTILQ